MGDAKEYLEIEDSIAPLEATLDRLSRISYSTFGSDNKELEVYLFLLKKEKTVI